MKTKTRFLTSGAMAIAVALMCTSAPADVITIKMPIVSHVDIDMATAPTMTANECDKNAHETPLAAGYADLDVINTIYLNYFDHITIPATDNYTCARDTATYVYMIADVGESPIPTAERRISSDRHTPRLIGNNKPWAAGKLVT